MSKVTLYSQDGSKQKEVELPPEVFEVAVKEELITRVLNAFLANRREAIAHTKTRSERRGGGAKPWKQKGTGRARHGSNRSPIWKKGGVTFGPRNDRNFSKKINKKEKKSALLMTFSLKAQDKNIRVLDDIKFEAVKTKKMAEMLKGLDLSEKKSLIVLPKKDDIVVKSARNIPIAKVATVETVNLYDVLNAEVCVMPYESCAKLKERFIKSEK
ncbi:50S ribosomal protein L4 [Patescibacteria group bacterium]|nr:50S ribosomal protein L4 [Patescibacteria group bacterium]